MPQDPVDNALVSIVLPTYNRAHLLGHAIRNVLDQTWRNLELIVVDDNSTDETTAVVQSFDDARIVYVRNDPNLRLPRALNRGFELSRGSFLTWTSDDNLYADDAIERMVAVLRQGNSDFVFADYFHFSQLDETTGKPLDARHVRLPPIPKLEESNSVGACFLYTRKVYETVGAYDPELFLVEDYDYFMRIQERFRVQHIAEPLYYFKRDDETLYCSRYAEVKAADVLVRYKNGRLDREGAANACVRLVMRNIEGLRNPVLRAAHSSVRKISYRLTKVCERAIEAYVARKIANGVSTVLERFSARALSFNQAKDALRQVMQGVARLEYK